MTIPSTDVAKILASCQPGQAEKIQEWIDRSPGKSSLDHASAALLFAAAQGDARSWKALTARHPELVGLDGRDMPAVLDQLFNGDQP